MIYNIKFRYFLTAIFIFILAPFLIFLSQDLPERTLLKESISVLVILAFSLVLGQFYLTRVNRVFMKMFKMIKVLKLHKIIGYIVLSIFFIHPFLIVLPRYFEAGVNPIDTFFIINTDFSSIGIIFGLIAWSLMIILLISSIFRNNLKMTYISWRNLHAVLALVFVAFSLIHIIDLGRHSNITMSIFMIILAFGGIALLAKLYFFKTKTKEEIIK